MLRTGSSRAIMDAWSGGARFGRSEILEPSTTLEYLNHGESKEDRLPLVRRVAPGRRPDPQWRRCAAPDGGARDRRRGDRDRRGVRPRPPFRPPTRLALPP